jgi:hypothetical protein
MFSRSQELGRLVTAAAAAVAAAAFAIPASADSGSCTPPAGADGWYCAALSMNNASAPKGSPTVSSTTTSGMPSRCRRRRARGSSTTPGGARS